MENIEGLPFRGLKNIFDINLTKTSILRAESEGKIPCAHRVPIGSSGRAQRVWDYSQIVEIGEKYGFLKKPNKPTCISLFSTKGGVLKSTIALNVARMHALHNIKTIIIDLDPQADISNSCGLDISEDSVESLEQADEMLGSIMGLMDLQANEATLEELIQETDIPTLDFIPSTPELVPLMDILNSEVRREEWLKDHVVEPLKKMGYELIVLDLAPSWSIYTSNALTSSDLLISPLETKIAHWRNHKVFLGQLNKFINKLKLGDQLSSVFVPVKNSGKRKLSTQIKQYYHNNVENCSPSSIRESVVGEEAVAKRQSVIEYAYNKTIADDYRELLIEVNNIISGTDQKKLLQ